MSILKCFGQITNNACLPEKIECLHCRVFNLLLNRSIRKLKVLGRRQVSWKLRKGLVGLRSCETGMTVTVRGFKRVRQDANDEAKEYLISSSMAVNDQDFESSTLDLDIVCGLQSWSGRGIHLLNIFQPITFLCLYCRTHLISSESTRQSLIMLCSRTLNLEDRRLILLSLNVPPQ